MREGLLIKTAAAREKLAVLLRRFQRRARWAAILCTGLFAVGTLARSAEIPTKEIWARGSISTWLLVGTGLVTAVWQMYVNRDRKRRQQQAALAEACQRIAAHVDEKCPGLGLRDVGVHIWSIGGPASDLRLKRRATFLLRERQPSAIVWRKGKGVIGTCWEKKAPLIVDRMAHFAHKASAKQRFCSLPGPERFNLEWDEFERTRHYKAIWAAPLFDRTSDPQVRGVVSIDVQASGQYEALLQATQGDRDLQAILGICEGALAS